MLRALKQADEAAQREPAQRALPAGPPAVTPAAGEELLVLLRQPPRRGAPGAGH